MDIREEAVHLVGAEASEIVTKALKGAHEKKRMRRGVECLKKLPIDLAELDELELLE